MPIRSYDYSFRYDFSSGHVDSPKKQMNSARRKTLTEKDPQSQGTGANGPLADPNHDVRRKQRRWNKRLSRARAAATYRPLLECFFVVRTPSDRISQVLKLNRVVHSIQEQHEDYRYKLMERRNRLNRTRRLQNFVGDVGLALFAPLEIEHLIEEKEARMEPSTGQRTIISDMLIVKNSPDQNANKDTKKSKRSEPFHAIYETVFAQTKSPVANCSVGSITIATEPESCAEESDDDLFGFSSGFRIEKEPACDLMTCPRILTPGMLEQLHANLPESLQMNTWERCFAIGRDGDSFITLLEFCQPYKYTVIVVRTVQGQCLGGFASEAWQVQDGSRHAYYGCGQSFLFASYPNVLEGFDKEVDPAKELQVYHWTGRNDYCQICDLDKKKLCMGGEGAFGLIVEDNFSRGQSGRCRTFGNPPLVSDFGGHFEIEALEIYGLVPWFKPHSPVLSGRAAMLSKLEA